MLHFPDMPKLELLTFAR